MDDAPAAPRRTNRRLSARRACRLNVRYRADSDWHPATAMDLSVQGCRLRVGEDLPRGGQLTVAFESLLGPGATSLEVEVPGTIMWSRREGLSFQAGIQFLQSPGGLQDILTALA
jgi:hypothetical protein